MLTLLLTTLLSLPLYPLNPTVQDTVGTHVLHVTAGAAGPNEIVSTGPDFSLKHELMIHHPIIVSTALEYRYGSISSRRYPHGHMQALTVASTVMYYRGTHRMTGYLGAGVVYMMSGLSMKASVADSLLRTEGVEDIDLSSTLGYRFVFGLRYQKAISFEVTVTNSRPDFVKHRYITAISSVDESQPLKLNDVRVSLGYAFNLSGR